MVQREGHLRLLDRTQEILSLQYCLRFYRCNTERCSLIVASLLAAEFLSTNALTTLNLRINIIIAITISATVFVVVVSGIASLFVKADTDDDEYNAHEITKSDL